MKIVALFTLFLSSLALAEGRDWTKMAVSGGCGYSESEAKSDANKALQNEVNFLKSVCDGAHGTASTTGPSYSCDTEPQTITCPVTCDAIVVVDCKL